MQKYAKQLLLDPSWNISITADTIKVLEIHFISYLAIKVDNYTTATILSNSQTDTALMRDAVLLFTQALKDMPIANFSSSTVDCADKYSYWEFGPPIVEKMKSVPVYLFEWKACMRMGA